MSYCEDAFALSFQERMESGREASRRSLDRRAYLGAAVTWKRPPLRLWWTVEDLARFLGVSTTRAKVLCGTGRVLGAVRTGTGKGSPWRLRAFRQADGSYAPTISPGRRGPALKAISTAKEVPF